MDEPGAVRHEHSRPDSAEAEQAPYAIIGRRRDVAAPLEAVRHERARRDSVRVEADRRFAEAIEAARDAGATWGQLADAAQMTRQGLAKVVSRVDEA